MKTSGMTFKRMSNKRFLKTERAIFVAYYKLRDYPSARKLAKIAHISRSTLYRHHKKVQNIPNDYEDFLLQEYVKAVKGTLKRDQADLQIIFLRTLLFISNHHKVFKALFDDNRKDSINRILKHLRPQIITEWRLTTGSLDKIYNVYQNEVLGIIELWGKQEFNNHYLDQTLDDILYLTRTAHQRLLPLLS